MPNYLQIVTQLLDAFGPRSFLLLGQLHWLGQPHDRDDDDKKLIVQFTIVVARISLATKMLYFR